MKEDLLLHNIQSVQAGDNLVLRISDKDKKIRHDAAGYRKQGFCLNRKLGVLKNVHDGDRRHGISPNETIDISGEEIYRIGADVSPKNVATKIILRVWGLNRKKWIPHNAESILISKA